MLKNLAEQIDKLNKLEALSREVEKIAAEVKDLSELAKEDDSLLKSQYFCSFVADAEQKTLELLKCWHSINCA